jgi:NIMA (never in mitosis gene a)-related kinase
MIEASSMVELPASKDFSTASIQSSSRVAALNLVEQDPTKPIVAKKMSLSTLSAWQILAHSVLYSSEPSLATIPESEHHGVPPPPQVLSAPKCSSKYDGWSTEKVESHYELLEQLGSGAFGKVFKAKRRRDGALACVKVTHSPTPSEAVIEEVSTLRAVRHPHIVHFYCAYCDTDQRTAIAMELCAGGDLEKWLQNRTRNCPPLQHNYLTEAEVMHCFVQVLIALQHVHLHGILHRDIKPSNIFLSTCGGRDTSRSRDGAPSVGTNTSNLLNYTLKLGDFGISKWLEPGQSCTKTMLGTPCYFSPELISGKPYNKKSDVWAAGCVLYELCALKRPFQGSSVSAVCVKILTGKAPQLPATCSTDLVNLVQLLLTKDPRKRPSINTILEMSFIQKYYAIYTQWRHDCGLGSIEEETRKIADQVEVEMEAGAYGAPPAQSQFEPQFQQLHSKPATTTATAITTTSVAISFTESSSQEAVTVVGRVSNKIGRWSRAGRHRRAEENILVCGESSSSLDKEGEIQYVFVS